MIVMNVELHLIMFIWIVFFLLDHTSLRICIEELMPNIEVMVEVIDTIVELVFKRQVGKLYSIILIMMH